MNHSATAKPLPLGPVCFLSALWTLVLARMRLDWALNPQYGYGWFVAPLAAWLLWEACQSRPAPAPAKRSLLCPATGTGIGCLFMLPVLRIVHEANPDWRLCAWALGLCATAPTLVLLYALGGRSWLRGLSFPFLFLLVAIPWPSGFEAWVTQISMRFVATFSAEALFWMGIVAQAQGNLIVLPQGVVGVDEACSGVRSLQTMIMAGLLFGQHFRLNPPQRGLLLAVGMTAAFLINLARALVLVVLFVNAGGEKGLSKWHDILGFIALALSFAVLFGLGLAWSLKTKREIVKTQGASCNTVGKWVWPICVLWVICSEIGSEAWFRSRETSVKTHPGWEVVLPSDKPGFRPIKLLDSTRAQLRFSEARTGQWQGPSHTRWDLYFLIFQPGSSSVYMASVHRPEVCLPAQGAKLVARRGPWLLSSSGLKIEQLEFALGGVPIHVFYSRWTDYPEAVSSGAADWTFAGRLKAAWLGLRHRGQRLLQLSITGRVSNEWARDEAEKFLLQSLRTGESVSTGDVLNRSFQ